MHSILSSRSIDFLVDLSDTDASNTGSLLAARVPRPPHSISADNVLDRNGSHAVRVKHLRMRIGISLPTLILSRIQRLLRVFPRQQMLIPVSVGDVWLVTVWTGQQRSTRRLVSFSGETEDAGVEEAADDSLRGCGGEGSGMTANVFVTLYWWAARGERLRYSSSGRLALNQPLNKQPAEAFQSGCVDRFRVRSRAAALSIFLTQFTLVCSSVHM